MSAPGWTLAEIARLCGGRLEEGGGERRIDSGAVSIDTRTLRPGDLFVALHGERDGHAFVAEAGARGAAAALLAEGSPFPVPTGLPRIRVEDPLASLTLWSAAHRSRMPAHVIGVTGSSGKTTTKDRLGEILSAAGPTHVTEGNRNNHIGVPLTLLGLRPEHRYAVVEIAMNRPGEIAPLAALARPHLAILTTVGWAHIGAFGTREAILEEKLSIATALDPGGVLLHPHDPWLLERLPAAIRARPRKSFGLESGADLHPLSYELDWERTRFATDYTGEVTMRTPGEGALRAALAACLAARVLGVPGESARRALEAARPRAMRMEPRPLAGAIAILDCYNASPESSLAAVDFLGRNGPGGRRWLVFGGMRELGERSAEAHRMLGERAARLDGLFLMGEDCRNTIEGYRASGGNGIARLYEGIDPLARSLLDALGPGDVVLIKGSRASAMERVYEACLRLLPHGGR